MLHTPVVQMDSLFVSSTAHWICWWCADVFQVVYYTIVVRAYLLTYCAALRIIDLGHIETSKFYFIITLLYRKSIGGQALQASASSNFRTAHHQHGGHPLHHQHLSTNNHTTQNTHQTDCTTEEEGVDVVGLDSSDSAYSHHSKFLLKLVAPLPW